VHRPCQADGYRIPGGWRRSCRESPTRRRGLPTRDLGHFRPERVGRHAPPWLASRAWSGPTLRVMAKRSMSLSKVYRLLEPGPVVLLSATAGGRTSIMTMSWQTPMEFEPPLVGCVISNRNYTYGLVKKSRECVINIPTVELATKVVRCGNTSGRATDKFEKLGFTPVTASLVAAPLIDECFANLECKVVDTRMVSRYGFFVLEVVKAWIDPARKDPRTLHHMGRGRFMVAGETIRLPSKKA